ncbi:LemA family protein [Blattabacterium cuenoti]|uniref:LemA family protein n=1 Tax=Blattabacterium cuenoti TaxID=1653831 RepID=UPI00163C1700|nr:LemA family protein [Blattabacterium cuenoti]
MKKIFLTFIISLLVLSFIIGLWSINVYNNLIKLNEKVNNQWAQVENVYQRRLDLIPNLVNTVKGSSLFENKTLNQVIEARSKASNIQLNSNELNQNEIDKFQKKQENLNHYMGKFLIILENYPNIKSTENFYELQHQLEGTENRINIEKNKFNEEVNNFNTYRSQFPRILLANSFKIFKEKGYLKSIKSNQSITVDFSNFLN